MIVKRRLVLLWNNEKLTPFQYVVPHRRESSSVSILPARWMSEFGIDVNVTFRFPWNVELRSLSLVAAIAYSSNLLAHADDAHRTLSLGVVFIGRLYL
jgi:hypothetical protein